MKVGDLVIPTTEEKMPLMLTAGEVQDNWVGVITRIRGPFVYVFWGEKFPDEVEYPDQLEVVE